MTSIERKGWGGNFPQSREDGFIGRNFSLEVPRLNPVGGYVVDSIGHDSQVNKMNCQIISERKRSILNFGVENFQRVGENFF